MHSGLRRNILITALAATTFGLGTAVGAKNFWPFPPAMPAGAAVTAPVAQAGEIGDTPEGAPPAAVGRGLPSFAALVDKVAAAVVHVDVVSVVKADTPDGFGFPFGDDGPFRGFRFPMPPPSGRRQGSGSGFVIRKDGIVVTNNHVVDNAKEITVRLSDGRKYTAKVLGRDPKTDLAVLKIDPKGDLPVVRLGDSEQLKVGEWVVAIGNPFGLDNTVTAGIVSAKGRAIGNGPYDQFIQTDAPINPGNSGGPLFNERGEVVGINSAIFSQSGGNIGIGFAIPINMAKQLLPQLEEHGHVTRGWLGVSIQKITPELSESLGVNTTDGALVADVTPKSPAAKAGIKVGDIIVAYNGTKLNEHSTLPNLVASTPIDTTVPVQVLRDGSTKTLKVTVAQLADDQTQEIAAPAKGKWGLALRELRPEERQQRNLDDGQGVLVAGVEPGSPADDANLHAGDIILQVNRTPVGSVEALRKEVGRIAEGKTLLLLVRPSEGTDHFVALAAR
jgi:serine protease Do